MAYVQPFPARNAQAPPKTFGPDLAVRLVCPDCQDPVPNIREEFGSGDLVCGNCGLVLGDRIVDTRSEWRTFANDEGDDPSRVGAAADPLMEGMEQLDTSISFRDGGSGLARELQRTMAKGAAARAEKGTMTAFREIATMCDQISLTKNIQDVAKQLYKRAEQDKILRGKSMDAAVACVIFIACRQEGVPRTFKEICQLTNVPKKTIGQCYKLLEGHFNLNSNKRPASTTEGPEGLLSRYVNHLDLPVYISTAAKELIKECRNHGVADGRSPISLAGAAIYFTSHLYGQGKSAKEIAEVAGVSDSTIKLVYKLMYKEREKLAAKEAIDSGRAVLSRLPPISDK